jgi:hypothetical protein
MPSVVVGDIVETFNAGVWKIRQFKKFTEENVHKLPGATEKGNWYDSSPGSKPNHLQWRRPPKLDLTNLIKKIEDNRGDELSIFPSYRIFCSIVSTHVLKWDDITRILIDLYFTNLKKVSQAAIGYAAKKEVKIKHWLERYANGIFKDLHKRIKNELAINVEKEKRPSTINKDMENRIMELKTHPLEDALDRIDDAHFNKALVMKILATLSIADASPEFQQARELHYSLEAYLKVARKRFADSILQMLDHQFLRAFLQQITEEIRNIDDEKLALLFAESPAVANRRRKITEQLAALKASKEEIFNFGIY